MNRLRFHHIFIRLLAAVFSLALSNANAQDPRSGIVIGSFSSWRVTDGDTFSVEGLGKSVRFLGIDTEETPKKGDVIARVDSLRMTWPDTYLKARGNARFPIKHDSPLGYETALWAKAWFSDVDSVRLERDDPGNVFDYYGRYLAYVIGYKSGRALNYNVECVRAGFSPYSAKYGFSIRYHQEFLDAEAEARGQKRGIWKPGSACYPDYEERLRWWNARGAAIDTFRVRFAKNDRYFFLGKDGELERLELSAGKVVVVFGALGQVRRKFFPYLVDLSHKNTRSAQLVFFKNMSAVFDRIPWDSFEQQYVYARGMVQLYDGRVQIIVQQPHDIQLTPLELDHDR